MSSETTVEQQLREWVDQLGPEHKRILLAMLAEDGELNRAARLDFAVTQLRALCQDRQLNWDELNEPEREAFLDALIRENELFATQVGRTSAFTIAPCQQCGRAVSPSDLYRIYFGERPPSMELAVAKLVVMDAEATAQFPLNPEIEITIGRLDPHRGIRPEIDLSKYDPSARISRRHARITSRGAQFFIEDLGSANGTIINGRARLKAQEPYPLANGDVVKIAETTMKFTI